MGANSKNSEIGFGDRLKGVETKNRNCPHNVVTTHPGSGTNLDYAFKNPGPGVMGTVLDSFVVSDHYPGNHWNFDIDINLGTHHPYHLLV